MGLRWFMGLLGLGLMVIFYPLRVGGGWLGLLGLRRKWWKERESGKIKKYYLSEIVKENRMFDGWWIIKWYFKIDKSKILIW